MPCRTVDWDISYLGKNLCHALNRALGVLQELPAPFLAELGPWEVQTRAILPTVLLPLMLSFPPHWHISHTGFQSAAKYLEGYGWIQGIQLQNSELSLWLQQGRSTLKLRSGTDNHIPRWFIKHMVSLRHRSQLSVPSFISARLLCEFLSGFSSKHNTGWGCNESLAWVTPALCEN